MLCSFCGYRAKTAILQPNAYLIRAFSEGGGGGFQQDQEIEEEAGAASIIKIIGKPLGRAHVAAAVDLGKPGDARADAVAQAPVGRSVPRFLHGRLGARAD